MLGIKSGRQPQLDNTLDGACLTFKLDIEARRRESQRTGTAAVRGEPMDA